MKRPGGEPPGREMLERFAAGTAAPEERKKTVRLLLAGDAETQQALRAVLSRRSGASCETELDRVLAKVQRAASSINEDRLAAGRLLAELDRHPRPHRLTQARNRQRFLSLDLAYALTDRSFAARFGEPGPMLADAELAVVIADRLPPSGLASDCRARAWCQRGNALRVVGRLPEADVAFSRALKACEAGSGDVHLLAIWQEQCAVLRGSQRRFGEAIRLLRAAVTYHRAARNSGDLGRVLITQAINALYAGDPHGALGGVLEALRLLEPGDSRMTYMALHVTIRAFIECDLPHEAQRFHALGREVLAAQTDPAIRTKIAWLEGQLHVACRQPQAGAVLLEEVRERYLHQGNLFNAGLVSMDLAEALCRQGLFGGVRILLRETLPVFEALGVSRELLASLIMLTRLEQQEAYLRIIRSVAARLERDPGAIAIR